MPDSGEQPGTAGDVRLTYTELGARLRITAEAARTLTRRRGWRRLAPNRRGAPAIVMVPIEELDAEDWRPDRRAPPDGKRSQLDSPELDQRSPPDRADRRADEANARADAAIALAADAGARADRAESALVRERQRADTLRDRVEEAQRAAESALQTVALLRQAEDERRARGRWARLRAAWLGD